jgi:hypothetical protein
VNEAEARVWVRDILDVMLRGAKLSPTQLDDNLVQAAIFALDNDVIWVWIWAVLSRALLDEEMIVRGSPPEVEAEAEKVGIDPFTIIAIIQAIMKLIDIFRNRK